MHIHPISIQVPSVTSVATGCIFLTALIILGMLGLKQFPAYLNRWDSQQARNEGVFAH
jgi:hypothetical protein